MRVSKLEFLAVGLMNRFVDLWAGGDRRPVTIDVNRVRPELRVLEQNWLTIRREAEGILVRIAERRFPTISKNPLDQRVKVGRLTRAPSARAVRQKCLSAAISA